MQFMLSAPLLRKRPQCYVQYVSPPLMLTHRPLSRTSHLGSLVLVVVVDLFVPEKSLVSVAPEEVLCPDVLVWVFDSLFQGRKMAPMLPVLVP